MDFDYDSTGMAADLRAATSPEALEPVLAKLARMPTFVSEEGVRGFKLYMRDLDAAIPHIANVLRLQDYLAPKSNDNVCIIATQFYQVGGHSRVAADISRLVGAANTTIILTDLYGKQTYRNLTTANAQAAGFHCRSFLALKSPTVLDRTVELHNLLHAIRPTRIFLLTHHMDLCAIAATYPFRAIAEFIHHADSVPTVGATVPYSTHVDLTTVVCRACRDQGLKPILTAMSLPPAGPLPRTAEAPADRLRIATCGHPSKYVQPAQRRWADWVIAGLKADPRADFTHIGPANDDFRANIAQALQAAGVDPARYVFVGSRPNLRHELATRGVNLFVSSYPDGGLRSLYEAMVLGIPAISPNDPDSPPLLHAPPALPGWVAVEHPDDMPAAIAQAKAAWPNMQTPEYTALVDHELGRFEDYVALRTRDAIGA